MQLHSAKHQSAKRQQANSINWKLTAQVEKDVVNFQFSRHKGRSSPAPKSWQHPSHCSPWLLCILSIWPFDFCTIVGAPASSRNRCCEKKIMKNLTQPLLLTNLRWSRTLMGDLASRLKKCFRLNSFLIRFQCYKTFFFHNSIACAIKIWQL